MGDRRSDRLLCYLIQAGKVRFSLYNEDMETCYFHTIGLPGTRSLALAKSFAIDR